MERLAGRIVLLWGWRRRAAAFAAGALAVLAQPPFDFFAACFISFPVLVWLLDGAAGDGGRGFPARLTAFFATGWWFGFGYFLAGLWWIGAALLVEADAHAWAMPFAVLGLPAVLALFFGLACALAECAIAGGVGLSADLGGLHSERGGRPEEWLFGEGPGGFVVAGEEHEIERLTREGMAIRVGEAGGEAIEIACGEASLSVTVVAAAAAWGSLGERMEAAHG